MKEKAIDILTRVGKSNEYIQSIYLWGSITTGEYLEGVSDIDSIAFVTEDTDLLRKDELSKLLNKELPGLKINFLYRSELNEAKSKGSLTKVIPPELILYEFNTWIHVYGDMFNKEDFVAGRVPLNKIIEISRDTMIKRFIAQEPTGESIYFIKALAKLLYYMNQQHRPFKVFRYEDLVADSQGPRVELAQKILEMKRSGWDKGVIKRGIDEIISLTKTMLHIDIGQAKGDSL